MIQQFLGALLAMSIVAVLFYYIWVQRQNIAALVQQIFKLQGDLGGLAKIQEDKVKAERQLAMMITISQSRVAREKALAAFLARPEVVDVLAAYIQDRREMAEFLEEMEQPEKAAAIQAELESILTALEQLGIRVESAAAPVGAS